ncbi:CHAT domain-containing protein [Sorangium sp. So ce854]|uniref:CHAT domain-containing protein n=1 Tax=Sorangium sp. So ce854 TaxID=3133322 RepID=UPI003F63F12B
MRSALEQASFEFLTLEEYDELLKERESEKADAIISIAETASVRSTPRSEKARPKSASKTARARSTILFLAADPTDTSRLRAGQELREIQEKLKLSRMRSRFSLVQRMSVRPVDISQAILDERPRIIHFSGHGTAAGELCFEDELGQAKGVQSDALAALFELVADHVECVLLNACYSIIQASEIARHIKYVIGMRKEIGDAAAILFSVGFYQALGAGKSIEEAHRFGCVQIKLQGVPDHATPELLSRG